MLGLIYFYSNFFAAFKRLLDFDHKFLIKTSMYDFINFSESLGCPLHNHSCTII